MFQYDADNSALDEGVWRTYQGSKFKIAHVSNIGFQRLLAKLQQPHRKKLEQGALDPQTSKEMLCEAISQKVLLDWQDVRDKSGERTPYSSAAGFKALMGDPEFRDFVSDVAASAANFRDEEVKELGKS